MIGCSRTRVRKQPIIELYFEFENELKFYNLEACFVMHYFGSDGFAIILKRKRKLVSLLLLSYRCSVIINVLCLFLNALKRLSPFLSKLNTNYILYILLFYQISTNVH